MTTRARLAVAALLSAAIHAVVMSGEWLPLPPEPGEPRLLQARLAPLPELKPAPPKPKARVARRRAAVPVPAAPAVAAPSPLVLPDAYLDEELEAATWEEPAAPDPPQQLALAAPASAEAVAVHGLPRRGRISYTLYYGEERHPVGTVVQTWEAEADTYVLTSAAESTGIVELLWPQRLRYVSRGRITQHGMQPELFEASRTRRGRTDVSRARFDWSAGSLSYGYAHNSKSAPLPADAQDLVSFIFQLVLAPPDPGRYRVPIASGSRFENYDLEVSAEQRIETPLGTLRTLPVRQMPQPGDGSIEIWLAADYRYLPVRIRHYDRRGRFSGEQMVNEIRVSDE
ncbi:MAG TPA: DUF3108 domain-containing protein [Burkholderiales bacterium]